MSMPRSSLITKSILIILSLVLVSYTFYRADRLSMTHDESSTYVRFHDKSAFSCLRDMGCWGSANNHLLNTFLFQKATKVFGVSELSIRLPNLLAHLGFIVFSILLTLSFTTKPIPSVAAFSIINFNPFLLDFFSLARGYGLAMFFLMAGLYLMRRYFDQLKPGFVFGSFFMLTLGTFSVFTSINSYVATWCALILVLLTFDSKISWIKKWTNPNGIALLFALILVVALYPAIQYLNNVGEFKWGSTDFLDTFRFMVSDSLYGQKYLPSVLLNLAMAVIIAVSIFLGMSQFWQNKSNPLNRFFLFIAALTITSFLISIAQHYLLGSNYPINRKSILLLVSIQTLLAITVLFISQKELRYSDRFIALVLIFIFFHFSRSANLDRTREWWYDSDTKKVLFELENDPNIENISLGVHWYFQPTTRFYVENGGLTKISTPKYSKSIQQDTLYDFYYVEGKDFEMLKDRYDRYKTYRHGNLLLKQKPVDRN